MNNEPFIAPFSNVKNDDYKIFERLKPKRPEIFRSENFSNNTGNYTAAFPKISDRELIEKR